MKKTILPFIAIITLFITTGCSPITPKYRVTVDALSANSIPVTPSSYTLKALGKDTDVNNLKFQNQAQELMQLLAQKGYTQADDSYSAKQVIYFDYGIEKVKEEMQSYTEPDISYGMGYGYYSPYYSPFYGSGFGYSGYTTYHEKHIYYNRYITLLAKEQTGKEWWRVDVASVGESSNLKQIVPALIESARDFIGTTTKETIRLVIKEKSDKEE